MSSNKKIENESETSSIDAETMKKIEEQKKETKVKKTDDKKKTAKKDDTTKKTVKKKVAAKKVKKEEEIVEKVEEKKTTSKKKEEEVKKEESMSNNDVSDSEGEPELPKISEEQLEEAKKELEKLQSDELNDEEEEKDDSDSYVVDNLEKNEDDSLERTVFVKGLNYDLRENDLKNFFGKIGTITRLEMPMKNDGTRNNGYCFVQFKNAKDTKMCMKMDQTEFGERNITVQKATSTKNNMGFIYTVFVKNLPFSATKEDLREQFEKFGRIHDISVPQDAENEGRNKGFAFVEFKDEPAAEKAVKANITIKKRKVFMSMGDKNGPRKRQMEAKRERNNKFGNNERRNNYDNKKSFDNKKPFQKEHRMSKKIKFSDEEEKPARKENFNNRKTKFNDDKSDKVKKVKSNKIKFADSAEE